MKGNKLVIAVILALIVCLVLIPTCAFAEGDGAVVDDLAYTAENPDNAGGDNPSDTPDGGDNPSGAPDGGNGTGSGSGDANLNGNGSEGGNVGSSDVGTPGGTEGGTEGGSENGDNNDNDEDANPSDSGDKEPAGEESDGSGDVKEEPKEEGDNSSGEVTTPAEKRNYTLTFKNGDKYTVAAGDSESLIAEILKEIGISGEIESITGSNDELFTIEQNENGEWILVSKQPFESDEDMTIKVVGQDEPITVKVTDPEEVLVDLANGNVSIDDSGTDDKLIDIKFYDDSKTFVTKQVSNESTIRVKQTGSDTTTTANTISVVLNKVNSIVNVILDRLNMKRGGTLITVDTAVAGSTAKLELDGENKGEMTGTTWSAAILKKGDGELIIQDENDIAGSLYVTQQGGWGASIGGNQSGDVKNITILSGDITIDRHGGYGACIGAGQQGNAENICILGGNVKALNANYGAAIGAGQYGEVSNITIRNATVKASSSFDAAIGAGQYGAVDKITIDNAIVEATNDHVGAAIGGGQYGADKNQKPSYGDQKPYYKGNMDCGVGEISINDSYVKATAKSNAIGSGKNTPKSNTIKTISISGNSIVDAKGNNTTDKNWTGGVGIGIRNNPATPDLSGWAKGISADISEDNKQFNTKVSGGVFNENVPVKDYVDGDALIIKGNGKIGVNDGATDVLNDMLANYGTIEIVDLPKDGYAISDIPEGVKFVNNSGKTLIINGVEVKNGTEYTVPASDPKPAEDNKTETSAAPTASAQLYAKYIVLEGKGQQWTDGDLEFVLNSNAVVKVLIDGVEVEFTVAEDGTVTIASAVIEALEAGTHEIQFIFADGSCMTTFTK